MRLVKGFLIVLSGLFIFITILSLFIPSRLMVTRAVVINAPADKVFSQVSNLQYWKHWQPVFMQDSAGIRFETGATGSAIPVHGIPGAKRIKCRSPVLQKM